ncbi:hypothetical protein [Aestuariibacter salexigens]|uniref:hypothetical protein n=1 Tax=Aestuariibacter salexigens TaxID=226010 RepID=UPI00042899D4|nr:hypothetical protein [Aestuariibacter salexigens]
MLASHWAFAQLPQIILDGKGDEPAAMFVQALLERAYGNLGYQIEYRSMPLARSWVEANAGRLDGLRARIDEAAATYPNLVKVPFTLFEFKLLLVGDRRRCGACDLSQIESVATVRGLRAVSEELKDRLSAIELVELTTPEQVLTLLEGERVDAILLADPMLPPDFFGTNPHWIQHALVTYPDYHYLNKRYSPLAESLAQELMRLEELGEVALLRERYGMTRPQPEAEEWISVPSSITAVSGQWPAAQANSGVYKALFTDSVSVNTNYQNVSWKRAKDLFASGQADVLVGAYQFENADGLLSDLHIDYQTAITAFAKDNATLTLFETQPQSVSVCYVRGYDFDQLLTTQQKIIEAEDLSTCFELYETGFADVIIDYPKSLFADKGLQRMTVFEPQPLFVVFQNNDNGRALKASFDRGLREIVVSGRLSNYYSQQSDYDSAKLNVRREGE